MTHCKNTQIKNAFRNWKRGGYNSLWACYSTFSQAKENAFNYCQQQAAKYSGYGLQIISANTFAFSVGFVGTIDGKEAFFYITKDYDRYIFIDELEA